MSKKSDAVYDAQYRRYAFGFLGALIITGAIYLATTGAWLSGMALAALLLALASAQLLIQLLVFLHIRGEKKPRWTLWSIVYTVVMMLIIVVGSMWIMHNMNYNMHMTPEQMDELMLQQNKKGF